MTLMLVNSMNKTKGMQNSMLMLTTADSYSYWWLANVTKTEATNYKHQFQKLAPLLQQNIAGINVNHSRNEACHGLEVCQILHHGL